LENSKYFEALLEIFHFFVVGIILFKTNTILKK